ncbi:MAG: L,D-transpeptidase family protein [Deltaproteobacteria bacterium]|nr:L,D-transpeptidase family protein [Deltaproteobacteria bacterium]
MKKYQNISRKGGWPLLDNGKTLRQGSSDLKRISILRKRLLLSGDLNPESKSNNKFDANLLKAVKRFQHRHGLLVDGLVGRMTQEALNVSVEHRVKQIKSNLNRKLWKNGTSDPQHILVNIADLKLSVIEKSHIIQEMRVIVGKDYRQTPLFSEKILYIVLNPYWYIPETIILKDFLPKIKKDLTFLKKNHIELYSNWKGEIYTITPEVIEWDTLDSHNLNFQFRQTPGPHNSMGRIKFIFPNDHAVFLHSTPDTFIFKMQSRAYSSGCIRIEDPVWLASYLTKNLTNWSREKILSVIDKGTPTKIELKSQVPIHIKYFTVWIDLNGLVHFRKDIYNRES